jgi:hypothetical protein
MRAKLTKPTNFAHALRRNVAAAATSREGVFALALAATLPLLLLLLAGRASAQGFQQNHEQGFSQNLQLPASIDETLGEPKLLPGAFAGAPAVYGTSRLLAPGWKATYGVGDADDTALYSMFMRLEEFRHRDDLGGRLSRDNWRHFLGLEYSPVRSFSFIGGIAKSTGVNGKKGVALAPTGYERLRFNTGLRWRGDDWGYEGWGVDTSFSYIPTGAVRLMGDAGYMPGVGDSGPTWLMSLTVSRRF